MLIKKSTLKLCILPLLFYSTFIYADNTITVSNNTFCKVTYNPDGTTTAEAVPGISLYSYYYPEDSIKTYDKLIPVGATEDVMLGSDELNNAGLTLVPALLGQPIHDNSLHLSLPAGGKVYVFQVNSPLAYNTIFIKASNLNPCPQIILK